MPYTVSMHARQVRSGDTGVHTEVEEQEVGHVRPPVMTAIDEEI